MTVPVILFQFVISSDGAVGLCVEHSFADGVCLSKLTADFLTRFKEWKTCYQEEADPVNSIPLPVQLEWSISAESQNSITEASVAIDR